MTIPLYYESTHKTEAQCKVERVAQDEKGWFMILSHTLFYPQGGGQPADKGYVQVDSHCIPISNVRMMGQEIRYYIERDYPGIVNKQATMHLDEEARTVHSQLHTAGHLISNIIETYYPTYQAIKGHHFPGESYVEFSVREGRSALSIDLASLTQAISQVIEEERKMNNRFIEAEEVGAICGTLPYSIPLDQAVRVIGIEGFNYQPCGGTHVTALSELKGLHLSKFKIKGNNLKVSYLIEERDVS